MAKVMVAPTFAFPALNNPFLIPAKGKRVTAAIPLPIYHFNQ